MCGGGEARGKAAPGLSQTPQKKKKRNRRKKRRKKRGGQKRRKKRYRCPGPMLNWFVSFSKFCCFGKFSFHKGTFFFRPAGSRAVDDWRDRSVCFISSHFISFHFISFHSPMQSTTTFSALFAARPFPWLLPAAISPRAKAAAVASARPQHHRILAATARRSGMARPCGLQDSKMNNGVL